MKPIDLSPASGLSNTNLIFTIILFPTILKLIFSLFIEISELFNGIACPPSEPNSQSFANKFTENKDTAKNIKNILNIENNLVFFIYSPRTIFL